MQILATDFWALWMKTMVAVGLTLSGPYVFKISKSFFICLKMWWDQVPDNPETRPLITGVQRGNRNGQAEEGDPRQDVEAYQDVDFRQVEDGQRQDEQHPVDIVKTSNSGRETFVNLYKI